MAISNCAECNQQISSEARTCPNCGFKQFNSTSIIGTILSVVFIFIVGGELIGKYFDVSQPYLISLVLSVLLGLYGYNKRATPN